MQRIVCLFSFVWMALANLQAFEVPAKPDGYVTDRAQLLSASKRQALESFLQSYEAKTGNQLVVATFPSMDGGALEDISIRLAEQWKVGKKGKDNGVILLIFKNDRKMRIEVGYGLEGVLTDAIAGQLIRKTIAPYFREGRYEEGVLMGVRSIVSVFSGDLRILKTRRSNQARELTPEEIEQLRKTFRLIMLFIVIGLVVLLGFDAWRYRQYCHDHRIYHERYSWWEWFMRFALLLFLAQMILHIAFFLLLASRGGYHGSRSGYGGFSGGGGSFGGGGASGGW